MRVRVCVTAHTRSQWESVRKDSEGLPLAATWTEPECITLSERRRSENDVSYDFTHMCNLRNTADERRGRKEKRDGRWVLYVRDESRGSTPDAKTMLYVN